MDQNISTQDNPNSFPTIEYLDDLISRMTDVLPIPEAVLDQALDMDLFSFLEWCDDHPQAQAAFTLLEARDAIIALRTFVIGGNS